MTQDNRLTNRLINYWNLLRKEDPMPEFSHFDPMAIGDIWPRCFQLKLTQAQPMPLYTYEYVGPEIVQAYGRDLTGLSLNAKAKEFPGSKILQRITDVIRDPKPIADEGQFVSDKHAVVKYRACLVPFGHSGKVDHVVVGLSWREFS